MYLGTSVLSKAYLVTYVMQKRIYQLKVIRVQEENYSSRIYMLKCILMIKPILNFPQIEGDITSALLVSFSDTEHGGKYSDYGKTGGVTGIHVVQSGKDEEKFYGVNWTSRKQRRISHSSFGTEIIAAADANERGFDLRQNIYEIFPQSDIKHEMLADPRTMLDTIKTLHECREYRLRRTL